MVTEASTDNHCGRKNEQACWVAGVGHACGITPQGECRACLEHGIHKAAAGDEHEGGRSDDDQHEAGGGHRNGGHLDTARNATAEHVDIPMAGERGTANQHHHGERGDANAFAGRG